MTDGESPAAPARERLRRRRLVLLAVVAGAALALAVTILTRHTSSSAAQAPAPTTTVARPAKPFRIVFPEGFTRAQMAERVRVVARIADRERHTRVQLAEVPYLAASRRAVVPCFGRPPRDDLEGFLFPATYDFLRGTSSLRLVRLQLDAFCGNWRRVDLSYARSKNLTAYDVLKIASMVEREAAAPSERKLIAAVIYNRLRARMPLGIDATLRYGLHIPPTEAILESQLHSANPFNTRRFYGLPPTPIANPGLASIQAAAHPAHVDYLYYARKPDHVHHFFTASGAAFERYLATHGYGRH